MRRLMRRLMCRLIHRLMWLMLAPLMAALMAGLAACAQGPAAPRLWLPELRLAPAALGASVSLTQRLTIMTLNPLQTSALPDAAQLPQGPQTLDVLLEVDSSLVQLAGFALNQRVLTLSWDGAHLQEQRHALLPAAVDGAHVLRDIQLVYWPLAAISAALPMGWTLEESDQERVLAYQGQAQVRIRYRAQIVNQARWNGRIELDNQLEHYRLNIESRSEAMHENSGPSESK